MRVARGESAPRDERRRREREKQRLRVCVRKKRKGQARIDRSIRARAPLCVHTLTAQCERTLIHDVVRVTV